MDVHLRFGIQRNKSIIHEETESIDGVVIPAHILAYQTPSTSAFISSLGPKGCSYIFDPMTFIFQNPKINLTNENDGDEREVRPSIKKLSDDYHPQLARLINDLESPKDSLSPGDIPEIDVLTERAIDFQTESVRDGANQSAAGKYLDRYDELTSTPSPRALVPPYFRFAEYGDDWYQLSLEAAQSTDQGDFESDVAPIICCPVTALSSGDAEQIVEDYSGFDHVILWVDGFDENEAPVTDIQRVLGVIDRLDNETEYLETLYGGYLMILANHYGLNGLSHGILYTQKKSYTLTPGSGAPPERFYIPKLHQFRSLAQTDYILQRNPELMCDCPICDHYLDSDPQRIFEYGDEPELLRRHFLKTRRSEADQFPTLNFEDKLQSLQEVYDRYQPIFQQIGNPDAWVSNAQMPGIAYLRRWADALS